MVSLFTVLVKGKLLTTSSGRDKSTVSLFKFLGKETEQEQNRLHSSHTWIALTGKNTRLLHRGDTYVVVVQTGNRLTDQRRFHNVVGSMLWWRPKVSSGRLISRRQTGDLDYFRCDGEEVSTHTNTPHPSQTDRETHRRTWGPLE